VGAYLQRASRYATCEVRELRSEEALCALIANTSGRTAPFLILTDSQGKQLSSEEFAVSIGRIRDSGVQQIVIAIGPADGWSREMVAHAQLTIAFGRITLPHELAAVVAAEQLYRALTILAGHPYHTGH
jgi:23S rRNA (pseudouridine1915-N3)-methyltransferase